MPDSAPAGRRSKWLRRALFSLVTAVVVFGSVEGVFYALRGAPPTSTAMQRVGQCELAPPGLTCSFDARLSVPIAPKGQRTRVVFLGGSTVRRDHGNQQLDDFPTWIAHRALDLEVINLGVAGYTTAGVWRLLTQIEPLAADLIVVMTGHNDYNASVFDGSIRAITPRTLPLEAMLSRLWLYHLATPVKHLRNMRSRNRIFVVNDDFAIRTRPQVDARFRAELAQVIETSPAPLLLTTLLRNYDDPPTGVLTRRDSACGQHLASAHDAANRGDWRSGAARARELCPGTSIAAFAKSHEATDRTERWAAWDESLRLDAAPLRAPLSADVIIREQAAQHSVPVVDLAALQGGYQPGEWFTDAIHTNDEGARIAADEVLTGIRAALR